VLARSLLLAGDVGQAMAAAEYSISSCVWVSAYVALAQLTGRRPETTLR
jgi:hypothetical protein